MTQLQSAFFICGFHIQPTTDQNYFLKSYIVVDEDVSILKFWYPQGSSNQSPMDLEGQL